MGTIKTSLVKTNLSENLGQGQSLISGKFGEAGAAAAAPRAGGPGVMEKQQSLFGAMSLNPVSELRGCRMRWEWDCTWMKNTTACLCPINLRSEFPAAPTTVPRAPSKTWD